MDVPLGIEGIRAMAFLQRLVLFSVVFISGCAQTVWVKPGASPQEQRVADLQCDVFAANATTRQPVYGHKAGAVIASAIVAGIAEGLEQANWKMRCMQANGFVQVPVAPAMPVTTVAGPAPTLESPQKTSTPMVTVAQAAISVAAPIAARAQPVATDRPKCTAYSYQEYLRQKAICDADVITN